MASCKKDVTASFNKMLLQILRIQPIMHVYQNMYKPFTRYYTFFVINSFKPFPTYNKSTGDDFENFYAKLWTISIDEVIITEKSWKHCVAKEENARFEQFLLLSQNFQKSSAAEVSLHVGKC